MANSTDQTDRKGIHAIGAIFTNLQWVFREQPTSDYGIDAQAEKLNADGKVGGRLIALQIKTGASYFRARGEDFVFYGEPRHLDYWLNHSLPVFIILHNPDNGLTLWQKIERHLIVDGSDGRWSITMPVTQTLDQQHEHFIAANVASDFQSLRRARLTLDLPIIRQVAEQSEVFLRIDDWVNKTLNFRGAEFVFGDDPNGDVDLEVGAMLPAYTVEYYMAFYFPWLDWELHEYIDESEGSYEVAVHILSVTLSAVGKAAIILDEFYQSKLPPFRPEPAASEIVTDWDESEFDGEGEIEMPEEEELKEEE